MHSKVHGLPALSILVVDDNRQMRTIIGTVLASAGVGQIQYAQDGEEGLKSLRDHQIDVAYVDYEMPRTNGLEFISEVRRSEGAVRYLPIIMLTGYSDLVRLRAAQSRGVNEFLRKPVTARDILARLEAVILNPRQFVYAPSYSGPDRRRRRDPSYRGPVLRASDRRG